MQQPSRAPEIVLPAATANSRCDELVGPQGSHCQQSKPRGCHYLGETGHCLEARPSHLLDPDQHTPPAQTASSGCCMASSLGEAVEDQVLN